MIPGANFYIYGGGRWREVDLSDGSVDGWGRVRFAYAKRGKVHVAKTRSVLTALGQLRDNKDSAIKDGARLPVKKVTVPQKLGAKDEYHHTKCCQSSCHGSPQKVTQPTITFSVPKQSTKTDASIQTSLPFPEPKDKSFCRPEKKHKKNNISNENVEPSKNVESINSSSSSSPEYVRQIKKSKEHLQKLPSKVPSLKLLRADSAKYNLYKRKRSNSTDSLVWVVLPKNKESEKKITYNGAEFLHTSRKGHTKKRYRESSSPSFVESQPKLAKIDLQSNVKTTLSHQGVKENNHNRYVNETDKSINYSKVVRKETNYKSSQDKFKELIIEEGDVDVLRNYLMNNVEDFDLLKFDEDDDYKRQFFYTINPLVNVERCRKIAMMLSRDSQSEVSLRDFASQLGLTSVSDIKAPKRYKMRNRNMDRGDTDKSTDGTDKENSVKMHSLKDKRTKMRNKSETDLDSDSELFSQKSDRQTIKNKKRQSLKESATKTKRSAMQNRRESDSSSIILLSRKTNRKLATYKTKQKLLANSNPKKDSKRKKSAKYDSNDSDSVIEQENSRILRTRKSNTLDLTVSSDSENVFQETKKKENKNIDSNKKLKATKVDLTRTDSDWGSATLDSDVSTTKSFKEKDLRDGNKYRKNHSNEHKSDSNYGIKKSDSKYMRHGRSGRVFRNANNTDASTGSDTKKTKVNNNKIVSVENSEDEFETKNEKFKKKLSKSRDDSNLESDEDSESGEVTIIKDRINDRSVKNTSKTDDEVFKLPNSDIRNNKISVNKPRNKEKSKNGGNSKGIDNSNYIEDDNMSLRTAERIKSLAKQNSTKRGISPAPSLNRVEYSNLEDHAIVNWISMGGRARCVNGNRVWKELQERYYNIVGLHRSWHSLRNRYLRSILPRLGQLALNPSMVSRLRAAAATGEIKSRNVSRRNSIFGVPKPGALSRRPRRRSPSTDEERPRGDTHTPPPSSRVLRSSLPSPIKDKSPRYSEITRNFALKHRESTPQSLSDSLEKHSRESSPKRKKLERLSLATKSGRKTISPSKNPSPAKSLSNKKPTPISKTPSNAKKSNIKENSSKNTSVTKSERLKSEESPRKSSTTETANRSLRKSLRTISPATKPSEKERTKTRRLFNPNK